MAVIVAIAGGSGSGKTTIAEKLVGHLADREVVLIKEDDYYRCSTHVPGFDPRTYNFDEPDSKEHELLGQHLAAARRGEAFEKPLYDMRTHTRQSETERILPQEVVILEGLHAFVSATLRRHVDIAVFVDTPESLRLGRRMVRDIEERARTPESIYRQFFRNVIPEHERTVEPQKSAADIVLSCTFEGDFPETEAYAEQIAARIRERLGSPPRRAPA